MKRSYISVGVWLVLVLFVASVFTPLAYAAGPELVSADVDERIEQLITEGNIPSLHVCVVSEDSINWVRGFGEETDVDTPFLIGSI
ncbi:MAG: hypothetical protein ACTSPR_07050, partial [Candidatus Thorarchaeota archaeon]